MKLARNIQYESEKVSYKSFLKAYGHNWAKVCISNAVLLLCNLLSMVIGLAIVMFIFPFIFPSFLPDSLKDFLLTNGFVLEAEATNEAVQSIYYLLCLILDMMMTGLMFVINGPVQCGIVYYLRNLLEGDARLRDDFKKGMKLNWKKSLGACILSILVTVVLIFNIGYYRNVGMGSITPFVQGFFTWCLVFWGCMQLYVYPLIACTDLSLKDVYRNAALFSVKSFFATLGMFFLQCLLFLVIPFVLIFFAGQIGYGVAVLLYLLFSFGFMTFLSTYHSWKLINNYVKTEK
ncbi:MAG: hypothetical protein IKD90_09960 [Clostridiales bacterium]|nr:hypothetical protein [Clostridiales bacterium]